MAETERKTLEFTDLPLMEVSARLTFRKRLPTLTLPIASRIAGAVRERFPSSEVAATREVPPGGTPRSSFGVNEFPSVRFTQSTPGIVVSVQDDMIAIHWAKHQGGIDYPRFDQISRDLWWFIERAQSAGIAWPPFRVVNLSYLNLVAAQKRATWDNVSVYLSPALHASILDSSSRFSELNLSWQMVSGLDRRVAFTHCTLTSGEESVQGYALRTVTGLMSETETGPETLNLVHDDLQDFFLEIISDYAKKEWGYVEHG